MAHEHGRTAWFSFSNHCSFCIFYIYRSHHPLMTCKPIASIQIGTCLSKPWSLAYCHSQILLKDSGQIKPLWDILAWWMVMKTLGFLCITTCVLFQACLILPAVVSHCSSSFILTADRRKICQQMFVPGEFRIVWQEFTKNGFAVF